MAEQQNNGWKWLAGGLALVVSYQLGYSSGSSQPTESALGNSSSAYIDPSLGNMVTALDAPAPVDPAPILVPTAPPSAQFDYPTEGALPSDATINPLAPPQPNAPTSRGRNLVADASLSDDSADELAGAETYGSRSTTRSTPTETITAPSYASTAPRVGCAENGTCYGDLSTTTGLPKTTYVRGYYRRDGTYVRSHYRSRR